MANLKLFRDFTFIVGIDIAKEVFQVYCCNTETGECTNRQVTRDKLLKHFANRDKCLIGMEACGQLAVLGTQASGTRALRSDYG